MAVEELLLRRRPGLVRTMRRACSWGESGRRGLRRSVKCWVVSTKSPSAIAHHTPMHSASSGYSCAAMGILLGWAGVLCGSYNTIVFCRIESRLGGVVERHVGLLAPDCPETAVWQAELRPRQLLCSRYDQCVVGKSRVRA